MKSGESVKEISRVPVCRMLSKVWDDVLDNIIRHAFKKALTT
jgi:hypothetical protein